MVTIADWIRVELSEAEQALAEEIAQHKQAESRGGGFQRKGYGNITTDRLGAAGHVAACRYVGEMARVESYIEERRRGSDLSGGREVRTRSKAGDGLGLHDDDTGPFLMVLGHEAPEVLWLVGWITAEEGLPLGRERTTNGFTWWEVPKEALHPLREKPGFKRRGADGWLVDPQTPFYCDTCKSMHPIIEHRRCRAGAD